MISVSTVVLIFLALPNGILGAMDGAALPRLSMFAVGWCAAMALADIAHNMGRW